MRILSSLLLAATLSAACLAAGQGNDGRQLVSLNPAWKFLAADEARAPEPGFDDSSWESVALPHTWNALDGEDGGANYRRGPGWYRRHLPLDSSYKGRRLYLQFDGASLMADVYVNGVHLGTHKGGFARFRFDATAALRPGADNVIAVRVDNGQLGIPPTSADFTFFGGLYRGVWLLATDPVQVSAMDYGSPGVYLEQASVGPDSAKVMVRAEIENHHPFPQDIYVQVSVQEDIGAHKRRMQGPPQFRTHLEPGESAEVTKLVTIEHPHLWNARTDPYLYSVRVTLSSLAPGGAPGDLLDAVEQPLGLRSFVVDPDKGFFLNGGYLDLRGFNVHQDWPDKGWAISDEEEGEDLGLMIDIGATAVRASHYQHSDSFYTGCDRLGIVVWAEIPFVNQALATPEFLENAKQQMRELIRQNFNHPSICFWGVGNETRGPDDAVIAALAEEAKAEDPGRLSTYATNQDITLPKTRHTDVLALNRYEGWYYGNATDIVGLLDKWHADYPKERLGMSEFGAGASVIQHAENPARPDTKGPFHPEEYQSYYHEVYWSAFKARPYLWAKFIWCLHDFASDGRNEGDHPGRNDKGLVTYDRKTKKDAYYYYKANWSPEPVLHLNSSRFTSRTEALTDVRVYSNAPEVALSIGGVALGTRSDPEGSRVFVWKGVRLAPGENRVVATAKFGGSEASDACVWTLAAR